MDILLDLEMLSQPNDTTCGPTCLQSIYKYYRDPIPLSQVISEVKNLETGGTLAVLLACHALKRGYKATIYTYNLQVFDPTWFFKNKRHLVNSLKAQSRVKNDPKLTFATEAYLEFLHRGGKLRFHVLNHSLLRGYLKKGKPIITGLSSTYLYQTSRENPLTTEDDDTGGIPAGHFVALHGYDKIKKTVMVADPYLTDRKKYEVKLDRLICSILLGIITYDANLLIIEPKKQER